MSSAQFKPVTHVIFDVDGLLMDTEKLLAKIMSDIAAAHGKVFSFDMKIRAMGKKEEETAKMFLDELQVPLTVEEYLHQVDHMSEILFPDVDLLPGAEKLIRHLHKHGIPMALASGSSENQYRMKVSKKYTELFKVFKHAVFVTGNPEVKNGKPAPDCFILCNEKFPDKPPAEKVLVFEDSTAGTLGALAANMQCVWVPDALLDRKKYSVNATQVLDSLLDFKPELFGLPPYDS